MSNEQLIDAVKSWVSAWDAWIAADEPDEEGPAPFVASELLTMLIRRLEHSDQHRYNAMRKVRRQQSQCRQLARAAELARAKRAIYGLRIGELERSVKNLRALSSEDATRPTGDKE